METHAAEPRLTARERAGTRARPEAEAIALRGVTRVFGDHPALVRVDLRVPWGEALLVSGPNGAGKTTLLRLIATALSPTHGGGEVLGFDLLRGRREIRARAELVGHRTRLYEDLTPAEYLGFVATLWRPAEGRGVGEALARAGLESVAGERIRGLSQGTRQRLALARALLRRPELVLLDEPYGALDEEARGMVDDVVREARAEGRTVLVATHDTVRAAALADREVRLEGGRLAGEGVAREPGGAR